MQDILLATGLVCLLILTACGRGAEPADVRSATLEQRVQALETQVAELQDEPTQTAESASLPASTIPAPYPTALPTTLPTAVELPTAVPIEFEIAQIDSRVTETNAVWWKYAWLLILANQGEQPLVFEAEIKFLDRDGFIVHNDRAYDLVVEASETREFSGFALVDASVAPNVAKVSADVFVTAVLDATEPSAQLPAPTPPALSIPAVQPASNAEPAPQELVVGQIMPHVLNASMVGTANPQLPSPGQNDFDVIVLQRHENVVHLFIRNNTDQAVGDFMLNAVARNSAGQLLAVEETHDFEPEVVRPGEVAYDYLVFLDVSLPPDAEFEYEVTAARSNVAEGSGGLVVSEYSFVENRFVGILVNPGPDTVQGYLRVQVLCFGDDGRFLEHYWDSTTKDKVPTGGSIPFQVGIGDACPTHLIYAMGGY